MQVKHYESVFILNPVLSDAQVKETVDKFKAVLANLGAEISHEEFWGLRKLAYPIQKKSTGYYVVLEFHGVRQDIIKVLEIEFKRDEKVMRFLTVSLDKHAISYLQKKRGQNTENV
jgi:small subunit ribosomal protein S6